MFSISPQIDRAYWEREWTLCFQGTHFGWFLRIILSYPAWRSEKYRKCWLVEKHDKNKPNGSELRCNDRGINVLRNREGPEVPTALSQTPGFFVTSLVVISREVGVETLGARLVVVTRSQGSLFNASWWSSRTKKGCFNTIWPKGSFICFIK